MITPDFRLSKKIADFRTFRLQEQIPRCKASRNDKPYLQTSAAPMLNLRYRSRDFALFARADIPQELPGINSEFVAIVPVELDGVFAHRFHMVGLGRSLKHRQRPRG
jgi:hypothetical protein